MKSNKLKIKNLKVNSFITEVNSKGSSEVKGGLPLNTNQICHDRDTCASWNLQSHHLGCGTDILCSPF